MNYLWAFVEYVEYFKSSFPFGCFLQSQQIICLHLTPSSKSSSLTTNNFKSSFSPSINLLFGLSLDLLIGSSNLVILLPIYSLSLLWTCPNHLSLVSLSLLPVFCSVAQLLNHTTWQISPLSFTPFLSFSLILLSHITPDAFLYPFQPASSLLFHTLRCSGLLTLST